MHRPSFLRRAVGFGAALALGSGIMASAVVAGGGLASAAAGPQTVTPHALQTVATGLNSPRHLIVGPDGALYVAEAGTGGPGPTGSNCVATVNEASQATTNCLGTTGVIARVTTAGVVSTVLSGLPSVVTEPVVIPAEYAGPSDVAFVNGKLEVTTQDVSLNSDGTNKFGAGSGTNLGQVITATPNSASSTWTAGPNIAAYEAAHPQSASSLGTGAGESATDSDPYAITPYNGGFAVADAAANSLLWVSPAGVIGQLASFPAQTGTSAQAVPTSVTVGPDGALYVGELVGAPSPAGSAVVYRVEPGSSPTVYATGFSAITDVAFDRAGRLLVLEYDTLGLLDQTGASGAVIRVANGVQTVLASTGLTEPTGMAVGPDGSIYVSNNGDVAGAGSIVRIPISTQDGYQEVAADGGAFDLGSYSFNGSLGGVKLDKPIVGGASTRLAAGYWLVASDGGVFNFGAAPFYGSLGGTKLNAPIVGMAPTPDGHGYWLVGADGGVFNFGDAGYFGSEGGKSLNAPVVGIAATPDGGGYWLVAKDGGVFALGDARFLGSEGGKSLNAPVVGIAATSDGGGYWLVGSDGGIFNFGDAAFEGSEGGKPLDKPVVGIAATPDNAGYWLVASDGGIFNLGDAGFFGSEGGKALNAPVVGLN